MMFWILSTHPVDTVILSRSLAVVKGLLTAVTSPRLQVNMVNDITRFLDYTIHLPIYVTFPPLNKQEPVVRLTGHDHHCATRAGFLGAWGYHLNSLPQACDQRYGNDSHQKLLTPSIIITSTLDINSFLLCSWISFKHFGLVIIASKSAGIQCEASLGFKEFSYFFSRPHQLLLNFLSCLNKCCCCCCCCWCFYQCQQMSKILSFLQLQQVTCKGRNGAGVM